MCQKEDRYLVYDIIVIKKDKSMHIQRWKKVVLSKVIKKMVFEFCQEEL